MSKAKTRPLSSAKDAQRALTEYLANITPAGRKEDAQILLPMMQSITGEPPVLWGPSIVGFGSYHYRYESGHEGDSPLTGFAARKANMVVYIMPGFDDYPGLLKNLGKHKLGASCLYLGRLSNVDLDVLQTLIQASVSYMRKKYPPTGH